MIDLAPGIEILTPPASRIVDAYGHIVDRQVRAAYDRICDSPRGPRLHCERVRSAEAYLRLVLRLEAAGNWDHANGQPNFYTKAG
jgi:hypothetical protein